MKQVIQIIILLLFCIVLSHAVEAEEVCYDERSGLSSNIVGGGVQDRNGLLWFATWTGLNCYDGYDFHRIRIHPGDGAPISTDRIRDIMLSPEGNIWCHTDDDVLEFNLTNYTFTEIPKDKKQSVRSKMGRYWHGMSDSQGNRWTSDSTGLHKSFTTHHPASPLAGTEMRSPRSFLIDRDGMLWVGMRKDNSVNIYDKGGKLHRTLSLGIMPYCLFQTSKGTVWAGGKPGGMFRIGEESITQDAVYDIQEDKAGRLWVATFGNGVKCCSNPDSPKPVLSKSFGGKKVRKLLITNSGNIVAATTEGLLVGHIDARGGTSLREIKRDRNDRNSLSSDATISLAQDGKGTIYVCTESSGIDMIDEKELMSAQPQFRHLNTGCSTMASDICNAMALCSDTLLIVVGNDNVMSVNPVSGVVVNYSKVFWNDECKFAESTPVVLADGTWVIGAEQGAFVATPHNLYTRGFVPPLVFTSISINGGMEDFCLVPREEYQLSADQRNVSIRFAAIDYVNNTHILYRTRMDGGPWTAANGSRFVSLFNLTKGEHLLEVQSTDRYGRWVNNVRTLRIIVEPYWYETWLARLLFAVIFIALNIGVVYTFIYIRRVNRQRRELLEKYTSLIAAGMQTSQDDDKEAPSPAEQPIDETEQPLTLKAEDAAFLDRVRQYIEENISNPDANIDDMAMAAASSRSTLNRHLRSLIGVSAAQLLIDARMKHAKELLDRQYAKGYTIADIAKMCGYTDVYYFKRVLKKKNLNYKGN